MPNHLTTNDDDYATVAFRPIVHPTIKAWREEYLHGFGEAARDLKLHKRWNPDRMAGGAFSARVMGYRAAVAEAGRRKR